MRFLHYVHAASVLGRHSSLYHCSINEVYLSEVRKNKNLYKLHKQKHGKCNLVPSLDKETAKRPEVSESAATLSSDNKYTNLATTNRKKNRKKYNF